MQTEGAYPWLASLFVEIEQAQTQELSLSGTVQRRLRTNSTCDIFIGVQKPENVRLFTARFHLKSLPPEYDLPDFSSLDIQVRKETEGGEERLVFTIRAPQPEWNDIFTSLTDDVVRAVVRQTVETEAAQTFRRRLLQWQMLLRKAGLAGLTDDEQQGLYGELWCLRDVILPALQIPASVSAWTGPDATDRDFQFARSVALEVKTTRSSGMQVLTISSERQLDDAGLNSLYVLHLALERMHGTGETLSQIVSALRATVGTDVLALSSFEDKLLTAGYLETQAVRYGTDGYTLHGVNLYRVRPGFPRIVPQDLLSGVGGVRYMVSTSMCQPFAADLRAFVAQLGPAQ